MINTAYVHFPVSVKSGALGRTTKDNNNLIKYFLKLKEQGHGGSPGVNQGWKKGWDEDVDPFRAPYLMMCILGIQNIEKKKKKKKKKKKDYPRSNA